MPRVKPTPAQAIEKLRGKRQPKTWGEVARLIEERGHLPAHSLSVGFLHQIMHGQRDANNEIRMALKCELKDVPGQPCGKKLPDGTRCLINHGSKSHPKAINASTAPSKPRVTLDTLRSTHEIEIAATPAGVSIQIYHVKNLHLAARDQHFDSWSAAMHWLTHEWAKEQAV